MPPIPYTQRNVRREGMQIGISRETFRQIDQLARSLRTGSREWIHVMDTMTQLLARSQHSEARRLSRGFLAAHGSYQSLGGMPWTIPVRRLSGDYYEGWKVRRIAMGMWEMKNESREAYMIEYGINPRSQFATPRPILKMSAVATLRFVQRTRLADRMMSQTLGHLRDNQGRFRSFSTRLLGTQFEGMA